jgi:U4/U6 small nuclear ribonucleoprotein PRP3
MPEGSTYDDIDKAIEWMTTATDTLVNHLIQHPIPIPAPGDRKQEERDLMLTKKEQKKMRRQRRKAELQDKQDRQKMGLLPPDAPKGKWPRFYGVELY